MKQMRESIDSIEYDKGKATYGLVLYIGALQSLILAMKSYISVLNHLGIEGKDMAKEFLPESCKYSVLEKKANKTLL